MSIRNTSEGLVRGSVMKKIELNLVDINDKKELHKVLKAALDLPDYYGGTLDSLHDCLTDITEDMCVGVYEPGNESEIAVYFKKMNKVFAHAEKENPHLCIFIFREGEI